MLGDLWRADDMPSGNGKPSKASRICRARLRELAAERGTRICAHCARTLRPEEDTYCRLCTAISIAQEPPR